MRLTSLSLTTFRNHAATKQALASPLTIFVGSNGAGKTTILEAIRCLSLAKSFRAITEQDVIGHEAGFCRVEAEFTREDEPRFLTYFSERSAVSKRATRKQITIDGVKRPLKHVLGTLPTVLFMPEDLSLVSDSPSSRRKYIDTLLCQTSLEYYASLVELRNVLRQRNKLLGMVRDGEAIEDELDAWNPPFAMHARVVLDARKALIDAFNATLTDAYAAIAGKPDKLELDPAFTLDGDHLSQELCNGRRADIAAARTLRGPHRDDFAFLLNGRPLASFGSRGERRSAILALKMAELDILEQTFGERPLLLLDDIFSELDQGRQNALLELMRRQQTIVTTTDLAHLHPEAFFDASIVHVERGAISADSESCDPPEEISHSHDAESAQQPDDGPSSSTRRPRPHTPTNSVSNGGSDEEGLDSVPEAGRPNSSAHEAERLPERGEPVNA